MNVWVSSDQHFLHKNILLYDKRNFQDEYEMGEYMIKQWNSLVEPEDVAIHLGDLFCGIGNRFDYVVQTIRRLNGKIILIPGNHDHQIKLYEREGIQVIKNVYMCVNGIMMSHYPIPETPYDGKKVRGIKNHIRRAYNKNNCWLHLHGHVHSMRAQTSNAINVCCNQWDYKPLLVLGLLDEVKELH